MLRLITLEIWKVQLILSQDKEIKTLLPQRCLTQLRKRQCLAPPPQPRPQFSTCTLHMGGGDQTNMASVS